MKKIIIKWLIFAGIIMATCYLPGIEVENFGCAMLVALVLTIINLFIKPIIKLLTFPINIFTFGIFNLLLNFAINLLRKEQMNLQKPERKLKQSLIIGILMQKKPIPG